MLLLLSVLVQVLAADGAPACQRLTKCPAGWDYYRPTHKCLQIRRAFGPMSFSDYEATCQWDQNLRVCDGHLAQISNAAENEFIWKVTRSKMFPRGIPTITDLAMGLMASVWVGYRVPGRADLHKKHEFRWLDGSPKRFENWITATPGRTEWYFAKQPDNGPAENCVVMSLASGKWADVACDGEQTVGAAICQIRLPGKPAPAPRG